MLSPEIEKGNREYKRYLIDITEERLQSLVSQMIWRITEGNGIAYYYIGVNDNGSIYGLNKYQVNQSMKNFRKVTDEGDVIVEKVCKIYIHSKKERLLIPPKDRKFYFEIKIRQKDLKLNCTERRILLLGNSGVGKTTFLSYLIRGKLDTINTKARLYILNHKHEIESGKTSSFNYHHYICNGVKYVFLDTPGDEEYSKTRNKIILSYNFDLVVYFHKPEEKVWDKKELYYNYVKYKNIPWIELNIYGDKNEYPNINLKSPPKQSDIIDWFISKIKNTKIVNKKETDFILLKTYPHPDLGWVLSGFLRYGSIRAKQEITWYDKEKQRVKIQSIHVDNHPVKKISAPVTATICLNKLKDIEDKPKYGFLNNKTFSNQLSTSISWIWKDCDTTPDNLVGYIDNNSISLHKIKDSDNYKIICCNTNFNLNGKIFITDEINLKGFCILNCL